MVAIFTGSGTGLERGSCSALGGMGLLGGPSLGRGSEQIFLNAANGNLVISRSDEFLVGRGPDVAIARTYNSQGDLSDENGDNWRQSTARRIYGLIGTLNTAGSTVKRVSADGSEIVYTWDATKAAYVTREGSGAHDTLTCASNIWTWTDGATQYKEKYAAAVAAGSWRITELADTDNNKLTFTYLASTDKLDKVTTADGSYTQYGWSGNNITQIVTGFTDLATSTAKTLTRTTYAYTANRLSSVTVDRTPENISDSSTYTTSYTYDASGRVNLVTQTDGSSLVIAYDGTGKVTTLTQTASAGVTRVTTIAYFAGYTTITDPTNQVTRLDHNAGRLTKITAPPAQTGTPAQVVEFQYHGTSDDLWKVIDASANVTTFAVDTSGNVTSTTDRLGNVVTRTYGAKNELLTETRSGSNAGSADALHTSRFAYDSENHLRYAVSAEGRVTEYRYTAVGQLQYAIDYPEHFYDVSGLAAGTPITEAQLDAWRDGLADRSSVMITLNYYDARGNLTQSLDYGIATTAGAASSAEGYSRTYSTYDQAGRLLSRYQQGQETAVETFVYDGMNRLVASTDVNGGTTSIVFNDSATQTVVTLANGLVRTSTYNKAGELVSLTESGQYVVSGTADALLYDKEGRLRVSTDSTGNTRYFLYDKVGRQIAEADEYGNLTEYRYDTNDRLIATARYATAIAAAHLTTLADPNSGVEIATIRPAENDADLWTWKVYDKEGRLIEAINGDGSVTTLAYDKSGRLVKTHSYVNKLTPAQLDGYETTPPTTTVLPATNGEDRISRSFYDKDGRLIGVLDGEGYLSRNVYDHAGRKIEQYSYSGITAVGYRASGTFNQLLGSITLSSANDRVARFVYDGQGLLRYEVDSYNQVTQYTYNYAAQLTTTIRLNGSISATTDYTYDNIKALVTASGLVNNAGTRKSWLVYDGAGRLAYSVNPENGVTGFAYDSMGQIVRTVQYAVLKPTTSLPTLAQMDLWATTTGVNATNRITRNYYSDRPGEIVFSVDAEGYVRRFTYDAEGRQTETRAWDNAISVTDATAIATVESLANASGTSTISQTVYDLAGRVTTRREAAGTAEQAVTQYAYNALDQLVRVTDPRNYNSYLYYDGAGRQIVSRDAEDYVTETSYTPFGEVASITRRANKATNAAAIGVLPIFTPDPAKDATTSFEYDQFGQLVKTTDAMGFYESYTLNAFGDRISVRNKLAGIITNSFDRRGLLLGETLPMSSTNSAGTVVATTVTNSFEYNVFGDLTKMSEADGLAEERTTTYFYDRLGRLIEQRGDAVTALNQSNHISTSSVVPTEYFEYDAFGQIIESTAANGARTLSYYDRLGRKNVEINPLGTYSAFTYDDAGNVKTSRVYGTAITVPTTPGGTPPAPPAGESRLVTYTYDALNRLKTSSISGLRTGAWNGSTYVTSTNVTVTTSYDYDANGNVIKGTDGNGGTVFTYYDRLNRKMAQVDQEKYLTTWTLDAEGNVTEERRAATQFSGTPTTTAPPTIAPHADDRTTQFTYDRNGRRLSEWRLYIYSNNVSASGALGTDGTHGGINYSYNGLGQVTNKAYSTGDGVGYVYDSGGRLIQEYRSAYSDHSSASVTPTVRYSYDGLNSLTLTRQGGATIAAGDRFTRYTYGAGGRLATMTDANGAVYSYAYDAAGNKLKESYSRLKADGTTSADGVLRTFDLLGRVTAQRLASWNGSAWVNGDSQNTAFNAYGEVSQRGLNGLWQEQFAYDGAGRLWRTNSGDGVWRFFVYDANGNRTLSIESEGTNLEGLDLDAAVNAAKGAGATVGAIYVDGVNAAINVFDKRGMTTQTRLPKRQLTAATTADITTSRTYNAFGEVLSETDGRGYTTDFKYNAMGRLIEKKSPTVSWTSENGAIATARPTENYYYDRNGRLIGVRDANNNLTTRTLLAGAGYDGTDALVTAEFHPDTGVFRTFYDVYGDARILRNELGQDDTRQYDGMGRLIVQVRPARPANSPGNPTGSVVQLTEYYAYDLLGQRIQRWNSQLGSSVKELTEYDRQGRVVSTTDHGGTATTYTYVWSGSLTTSGLGTYGGWTKTTVNAAGLTATEATDYFDRTIDKVDFGGHNYDFTFDKAGRQVTQGNSAGQTFTYEWFNTGLIASQIDGAAAGSNKRNHFGYDAAGNRTTESYGTYSGSTLVTSHQNATVTWDALNRMVSISDSGPVGTTPMTASYEYDLNGNIRHVYGTFRRLFYDAAGSVDTTDSIQDYWYRYDSMNRFVVTRGILNGARGSGTITRGGMGYDVAWNAAGQRVHETRTVVISIPNVIGSTQYGPIFGPPTIYNCDLRQYFGYSADGYLATIHFWSPNPPSATTAPATPTADRLVTTYGRDAMGRVTQTVQYSGGSPWATTTNSWNNRSELLSETYVQGSTTRTTTYDYNLETSPGSGVYTGAYQGGVVTRSRTTQAGVTSERKTTYEWWDSAQQDVVTIKPNISQGTTWTSNYSYDVSGRLASVAITDGQPRNVNFVTDLAGRVLQRKEGAVSNGYGPRDIAYVFNGKTIAEVSSAAIVSGPGGEAYADFDQSFVSVSSAAQGADSTYTVQQYDTLRSIANRLWGDANLWYKLADANGLTGSETLVVGQNLVVPQGVVAQRNSASTFSPYDPNKAWGDLDPNRAELQTFASAIKPKKGNKCGVMGAIMLVVIAVAVTVVTSGALAAASISAATGSSVTLGAGITAAFGTAVPIAGGAMASLTTIGMVGVGAAAAAAGSVVSQAFGVATGIQDRFSWKGVAMSAISGGVGAGLGAVFPGGGVVGAGLRGAAGSAITQGVGVATGLQSRFDWAGVAAAGVGSAVGYAVGGKLPPLHENNSITNHLAHLGTSAASAIANGATRSLIDGTDFGDNILAALPDVIGSTIGNMIAHGVSKPPTLADELFEAIVALETANRPGPGGATAEGEQGEYLVLLEDNILLASADGSGLQGLVARIRNSRDAAEVLADYRAAMIRRGRTEGDFERLVELRRIRYELMIRENIDLGRELRLITDLIGRITDLPAIDNTLRNVAFWVTVAEDGPGPRPNLFEWGDLLDWTAPVERQVDYEMLRGIHNLYTEGLESYVHNRIDRILRQHRGNPPPGMRSPHAHHLVFFRGNGREQSALAIIGQMVLRSVGIDPYLGPENLFWAPNVAGQHTTTNLAPLVRDLRAAYEHGANRARIVQILNTYGTIAAGIGQ